MKHRAMKLTAISALLIASFNCGNAPARSTIADLNKIGAHVYCLQETGDRHRIIDLWCLQNGFKQVPFEGGQGDTPILYDPKRLVLLTYKSYPVMDEETNVGPVGAGPTVIHIKYVVHARFWDKKTHRIVNVINTHVVASWTRGDLPEEEKKARFELGVKHILLVASLVKKLNNVVVCGDYNATAEFIGMRPLTLLLDMGNTEGRRVIDFVATGGKHIVRVVRRTVKGTSSDHDPVVAEITMKRRFRR